VIRRRFFAVASAISLLLCLASVGLWVRSYARTRGISWRVGAIRWTLRAEAGTVGLFSPPYRADNERGAAAEVATLLKTGNVKWSFRRWKSETGQVMYESAAWERWSAGGTMPPDVARSMLLALEDPQSFVEAHLALAMRWKTDKPIQVEDKRDGACEATIDGLRVKLWPVRGYQFDRLQSTLYTAKPEIDRGQLPLIRAIWHRRIDRNRASIPIPLIMAVSAVVPFFYGIKTVRSRRWLARGCCPTCGYNLTGNVSGACPECGTPVPKEPAEKSPRTA
jgi:hypothetical protein